MATERRMSALLGGFVRTLLTAFPFQGILDHLVVRIAEVLPIGSAGFALISDTDTPGHVAASDDSALRFLKLQAQFGVGPRLTAHHTNTRASGARSRGPAPMRPDESIRRGIHPTPEERQELREGRIPDRLLDQVMGNLARKLDLMLAAVPEDDPAFIWPTNIPARF